MTLEEKAYLAGIIDGEGSIMLIKFHSNQYPAPCISIASVSLELLDWVKNKTGYGTIKSKKNYNPDRHQNSYTYIAKYNEAISILEMIEPYLVIHSKRLRAIMIINDYKKLTPRNGRYTSKLISEKDAFYSRFMAI